MFNNISTKITQIGHCECSSKKGWNAVQMMSNSKWFSDIANHAVGTCFLSATHPSRFFQLSAFLSISVSTPKKSK